MTLALSFTESSVRRAVTAARKAGLDISAVEISPDGTITIYNSVEKLQPKKYKKRDEWANA